MHEWHQHGSHRPCGPLVARHGLRAVPKLERRLDDRARRMRRALEHQRHESARVLGRAGQRRCADRLVSVRVDAAYPLGLAFANLSGETAHAAGQQCTQLAEV